MVLRIDQDTEAGKVCSLLSLGYGMDIRGKVVGFTAGIIIISLLQSIQNVAVVHPVLYLVGIRDPVPWSKAVRA